MSTPSTQYESETQDTDQLLAEEKQLASGNTRLAIIAGAIMLLAGASYALVPSQTASNAVSSMMPSMVLGDATVTGTREVAAKPAAQPEDENTDAAKTATAPLADAKDKSKAKAAPTVAAGKAEVPEKVTDNQVNRVEETVNAAPAQPAPAETVAEATPANVMLSGRILDEEGEPLAGATVFLKGSKKGTSTDAKGNYSLEAPAGDNTLVYGYAGYDDKEAHVRNGAPTIISLQPREDVKRRRRK
ncbi:carboxypeptidase-like regulatory domain-containing protein [Hymenobacter sp. BT491]|uniref:carboxypeptidase-like regulatory domain-containing protein n=1 Tax=Hymenobacter sp. BT491 TaxID=2766779 RepID=UPI001653A878|nr:carboxypeptidase-like regulatory domain-containing protein [Hymenobacter sp. BT491]MBC6990253.1 carboxypeptidase-like regulatory domain-containing protein [Hymenobacter sp. BT491]